MTPAKRQLYLAYSVNELKKIAWDLLSKCVRMEAASEQGLVKCTTCPKILHWKQMQAGHFVGGRANAILFDERGIHPQCGQCNVYKYGNSKEYRPYMERTQGVKVIKDLEKLSKTARVFSKPELIARIETYAERLKKLEQQ